MEVEEELREALEKIGLEKLTIKLKEKGIYSLEEFKMKSSEDVDQWKDIPVGFRIKIKKYLDKHSYSQPQSNQSSFKTSPKKVTEFDA